MGVEKSPDMKNRKMKAMWIAFVSEKQVSGEWSQAGGKRSIIKIHSAWIYQQMYTSKYWQVG